MGYYSQVSISLYQEDFEELVERAKSENEDAFSLIRNGFLYKADDIVTIKIPCVKWRSDFADVKFILDFLKDVYYSFKRIGDDVNDIETSSNDPYYDLDGISVIETTFITEGEKFEIKE